MRWILFSVVCVVFSYGGGWWVIVGGVFIVYIMVEVFCVWICWKLFY